MTDKVVMIGSGAPMKDERTANAEYVLMLEAALDRAKAGECIGGAVVELCHDQAVFTSVAGSIWPANLLGGLALAARRVPG